jgi:hypothetical protein
MTWSCVFAWFGSNPLAPTIHFDLPFHRFGFGCEKIFQSVLRVATNVAAVVLLDQSASG